MSPMPPERLPRIPPGQWTEAQKKVAETIAAGPRGELRGPFLALLRSPGLAQTLQQVGEYLRFRSPLDRRIAEMTAARQDLAELIAGWDARLAATRDGEPAILLEQHGETK